MFRIASGVELREFPTRFLTPSIPRLVRLWRLHDNGHRLRDDGVLHWPGRLVQAFDLLDRETRARRQMVRR